MEDEQEYAEEIIRERAASNIVAVLDDTVKSTVLPMFPLSELVDMIEQFGAKRIRDMAETNGWEVDFWEYFKKGENTYLLTGSLWHGEFNFGKR